MGWVNYIVVPKAKLMFRISRDVEEGICEWFAESRRHIIDKELYVSDWSVSNLSEQKIEDVACLLEYYNVYSISHVDDVMLYLSMKAYDELTYIVSEIDEKAMDELVLCGYRKLD